jgi:predicted secreted acid phosphatase
MHAGVDQMFVKSILTALGLVVLSSGVAFSFHGEPKNLETFKQELRQYHDSGEYSKDIARVNQQALAYLKARVNKDKAKHRNRKLAIVLDIDETALSNYADMAAMNFGGTVHEVEEAEGKGTDPAIDSTLKLYQYAKNHNISVFFITGRRESYREPTALNLDKVGYKNYDGLYLLPDNYVEQSSSAFKTATRKKIIEQGYNIVLSLSDQKADLKGGFADKAFKLPGPYYMMP